MEEPEDKVQCAKCDRPLDIPVDCLYKAVFCEGCFIKHLEQKRKLKEPEGGHGRPPPPPPPSQEDIIWGQAAATYPGADPSHLFLEDEQTKWFGFRNQSQISGDATEPGFTEPGSTGPQYLIETPRLKNLIA
ncbi:hypothetical protein AOL_s00054g730 [Orbilia oligospora ATCC 24927]|uniref:Uncharacterized protein n=2 Tax=Orbilia oligospora TaxID=2813651 RepID=G1X786_ARTOA|nr:hypothetical protein AOL_s00054g730 [Orbilia oligospora ATCC 24927]EGX50994.1 hypothetical protein AOL_s00054g730 [Orbilia oligospora ATCC 24927]KAF3282683.1 hypothetical protein TWF970_001429 [Orbilia oligospora]